MKDKHCIIQIYIARAYIRKKDPNPVDKWESHLCFMQPVGNERIEEEILKIFEVWHYDNSEKYHPTKNPDGGLFTQYFNTLMKMKLQHNYCCNSNITLIQISL
uniref:Uncharacterized protein n=1 Tax=Romanomermis culicivorax TaxID=13658 RepID=A0A915ISU8_ROMCU